MIGHYTAQAFTPRHVLFGSRWGELLAYDRQTMRSVYAFDDTSASECDRLAELAERDLDCELGEMIAALGHEADLPLPPSVSYWLKTIEGARHG